MTSIYEYQEKIITEIEEFIKTADVESYEISEGFREHNKHNPGYNLSTWRQYILEIDSVEGIDKMKASLFKVINNTAKLKRLKVAEEKNEDDKKKTSNADWWKEYYKENADYWQKRSDWWSKYKSNKLDWQKDLKKRDEENKKQLEESEKNRDEKHKKQFIAEVEMELAEHNVADERLSKRVGVSDWRDKIRQTDGFSAALSMKSDLARLVWSKLKYEYTCANCGAKKEEYTANKFKGQKCCSYECEKELRDKDKKNDDKTDDSRDRKNEFKDFSIEQFFTLLKKLGAKTFWYDFDTNQVMVEFNDNRKKQLKEIDSGLSSEEQENLAKQLKSTSKPITFSEVDRELNQKNKRDDKGNAGIIAAVVVAGLILAVIIGVVIGKSKKKEY